eukprot:TRINITY_DN2000_c0_g1_i2.p1 TRINITY_DN2000_c0_g1~~TRINITY_DN2000_c0_g1_i2.p1  ORF type:complete len:151 (-),score=39.68 TRINITY_DN2000_c0_g1_i2:426-878(-)
MTHACFAVKDLLNQEQFKSIRGAFEEWSEEELAAVDRSQFADIFEKNQRQIAIAHKFYKAIQAHLKPGPKSILLHKYGLDSDDPAAEDSSVKQVLVMDAADLTRLFSGLGAYGLSKKDDPEHAIRSFDALEPGAEYWPTFAKSGRLSSAG